MPSSGQSHYTFRSVSFCLSSRYREYCTTSGGEPLPCSLTFSVPVIYSSHSTWRGSPGVFRMSNQSRHEAETVERSLDSNLDSVDYAEEITMGVAKRAGFDEDDLTKIGMAVRESMVNAVVHGNRYNANKKVRFSIHKDTDRVTVRIIDEGEGFDVESVPDPLAPENLFRNSGRGIFLIRSFMDDCRIRRLEPGGTEVTLVKRMVSK